MTQRFRLAYLILLALTLPLQACLSDAGNMSSTQSAAFATSDNSGFVSLGRGIREAQVEVIDLKAPVGTEPLRLGATSSAGFFFGSELKIGGDYRIEARNGLLADGSAFDGRFAAEVRNFAGGPVYLNPVTTLVSRYLASHPRLTLAQAEEAVRRFLELPERMHTGAGLYKDSAKFSYISFRVAMGQTPLDAFIDQLVAEMSASTEATHAFHPQPELQLDADALGGYFGEKLVAGALGQSGGWALGGVLASIGTPGTNWDQVSAIEETLWDWQSQLDDREYRLSLSEGEFNSLQNDSGMNALSSLIGPVTDLTYKLTLLFSFPPDRYSYGPSDWYSARADIFNAVCRIYNDGSFGVTADRFDDVLRGTQNRPGLIARLGQSKTTRRILFNYQDSQDLYAARQYWENIQAQLFNLIDIYLSVGQSSDGCNSTKDSVRLVAAPGTTLQMQREAVARGFDERQRQQVLMYPIMLLPEGTAVDIERKTMVRTAMQYRSALYYPQHNREYSTRQYSVWNYAHLFLNSPQTPMGSTTPQYLRENWRLILEEEAMRIFGDGMDTAVQRGWPESARWGNGYIAVFEDGFVPQPVPGVNSYYYAIRGWRAGKGVGLTYQEEQAYGIAVRPLIPQEDYLPK